MQGLTLMVILESFAYGSCDFPTRHYIIEAKCANGHIKYQFVHFKVFFSICIFLFYLIVSKNASESTYLLKVSEECSPQIP